MDRVAGVNVGVGAAVSSVKVVLLTPLGLPAASLATTSTLMTPSPNWLAPVPRSLLLSVTIWLLLGPAPVTVLVTVWPLGSVKVRVTLAPCSAVSVKMPLALVASVAVAPSVMLAASGASVGAAGAAMSYLSVSPSSLSVLPAASYSRTLTVPPDPMMPCSSWVVGVPSLVV